MVTIVPSLPPGGSKEVITGVVFTVIETVFEVEGFPETQLAFDVMMHLI
jgi:hypothetical protein